MSDLLAVLERFGISGGGWLVAILVIAAVVLNPDKVEQWRGLILRVFTWAGSGVRRRYHRARIRSELNSQIDLLQAQMGLTDVLPRVDIRFTSLRGDGRPKFATDKVVVFLRDAAVLESENLVNAAMHYVGVSLVPHIRPLMNQPTNRALDLTLTRRLIASRPDALRHYTQYFVRDACDADSVVSELYSQLHSIEDAGFLPSVLLHQLDALAIRLGPAERFSRAVQDEVVGFVRYLAKIASRRVDEHVRLEFEIRYIRVGVILLGRDETLRDRGLSPYKEQIARQAMNAYHGSYVLAAGRKAELVKTLLDDVHQNEYFKKRIDEVSVDEWVVHRGGRSLDLAVGYIAFAPPGAAKRAASAAT